jgi:hypothetical protein
MATSGQFSCPLLGSFYWPLTHPRLCPSRSDQPVRPRQALIPVGSHRYVGQRLSTKNFTLKSLARQHQFWESGLTRMCQTSGVQMTSQASQLNDILTEAGINQEVLSQNGGPSQAELVSKLAAVPTPSKEVTGMLWQTLVIGLVAVLIISLLGIIFTVVDANTATSPDTLITVFTAALTGLIGLFVTPK